MIHRIGIVNVWALRMVAVGIGRLVGIVVVVGRMMGLGRKGRTVDDLGNLNDTDSVGDNGIVNAVVEVVDMMIVAKRDRMVGQKIDTQTGRAIAGRRCPRSCP